MRLHEAFAGLPVRALHGTAGQLEIAGVQCDSRLVTRGELFVAVPGVHDNGLRFVSDALKRGCVAVAAEVPPDRPGVPWIELDGAVRPTLARLACRLNGDPSHKLRVYAVTGTNGKTTTAGLTRDILMAHGVETGLLSTVCTMYSGVNRESAHTTPDACALQGVLREMVNSGCRAAVMEASSHALDQHRCDGTSFAALAFTNLTQDHLDYHRDMVNYYNAKLRLFVELSEPGTAAVINTDDPCGVRLAQAAAQSDLSVITYGLSGGQEIRAETLALSDGGATFHLCTPHGTRNVTAKLAGRYNVMNMLCATGLALAGGVPLDAIVESLSAARPRWGRLEMVTAAHPARLFVDYAHTDDALDNVLAALREITGGRLIVVFGCGGDRDRGKRPKMAAAAARHADLIIVTSDNPRSEVPEAIIAEIVAGMPPGASYQTCVERRAAIALALQMAQKDDVVLVAGKGHETGQIFAHETVPFDDRQVLAELAAAMVS